MIIEAGKPSFLLLMRKVPSLQSWNLQDEDDDARSTRSSNASAATDTQVTWPVA